MRGPGPPAAFYRYSPDRKGERPRDHLAGFKGLLHADAYAGYDALYRPQGRQAVSGSSTVACMGACRRKLFEVFEATKSPIAEEGLRRIQELYAIEAEIKGQPTAQRWQRQARSEPLLDALHDWCEQQRRRLSTKSGARQGAAVRAEPLGCADPLHRPTAASASTTTSPSGCCAASP